MKFKNVKINDKLIVTGNINPKSWFPGVHSSPTGFSIGEGRAVNSLIDSMKYRVYNVNAKGSGLNYLVLARLKDGNKTGEYYTVYSLQGLDHFIPKLTIPELFKYLDIK